MLLAIDLEWSVAAPPPEWNFATIPHVGARDAFYWRKRNNGAYRPADHYRDIELPKESALGVVIGLASFAVAFGLVWHIWWMVGLFAFVIVLSVIARALMRDRTKVIPAAEVERVDRAWLTQAHAVRPVPREQEMTALNQGLAKGFPEPVARRA